MGGKTSTSSSQVQIPPEVLARYNSVNATAQNVAQTPFQQYSTNPNAFVAPMTATQNAGVAGTNAAAGEAQPYFNAATGFALAGSQPVNAAPLDTSQYMNPYLNAVLGSTEANVNQQNQQAMSGQTGNAMSQGYFGGDRSGIASAVLQGQQELAGGQLYSGIASDAYTNALAAAQQQQGVNLGAAQANRAATQNTASTLAGLGTGAQGAALEGAQAQLGAGQVEQQTQQAGDTALYNQFLQQQSYPFQTAQFLANIAEGTGALSGSTTTSTQPGGLFSDERLKEDMEPIGKGFDGANIYRFRYKGDPTTRIGLSAQETERKHPEAVSEHGGFKAVDYGQATEDAARRGGFALAANDNGGDDAEPRRARQAGGGMSEWGSYPGGVNPMVIAQLLQAQATMYGPGFGGAGLYGNSAQGAPHGGATGYVPPANLQVPMLQVAHPPAQPQKSALDQAASMAGDIDTLSKDAGPVGKAAGSVYGWGQDQYLSHVKPKDDPSEDAAAEAYSDVGPDVSDQVAAMTPTGNANGGFIRARRQDGGLSDPENDNPYAPKGPGLNIPMQGAATPKLATAPTPGGGGGGGMGGLGSMLGAGADIATIAKAAPAIGSMASGIGSGIASLLPFLAQRGGRAGYADGGDALDIPDDTPHAQLAVAQPPKQGNGGDNAMGDIMDVAKIAAMFAARGGRIGRAPGGDVSDDVVATANVTDPEGAYQAQQAGTTIVNPQPRPMGPRDAVVMGTLAGGDPAYAAFGADAPDEGVSNPATGGVRNVPVHIPPPHRAPPIMTPAQRAAVAHPVSGQTGDPVIPGGYNVADLKLGAPPAAAPAPSSWTALGQQPAPKPTAPPAASQAATRAQMARAFGAGPGRTIAPHPAVSAAQAATAAQQHANQARQAAGVAAASAGAAPPSTPASLAAAAATGMPSSVSTPGFGNASSAAAADSSMAAQVPPSTADVRGFGRAGVPSAAAAVPDILASAQGREAAPPLSDTDAAAGLGQGPTDPTTGLAAAPPTAGGFGSARAPAQGAAPGQPSTPAGAHAAASAQQGGFGGLLGAAAHALGKPLEAVAGLAGYNPQTGQWDRDKLIPFISAIAGTLAAPTKYPLVALSQGALAGGQSYMQQQQREAALSGEQLQNMQYARDLLPPNMRNTFRAVPGPGGPGQPTQTIPGSNQQYHYEPAWGLWGGAGGKPQPQQGPAGGAPAQGGAAAPAAATPPGGAPPIGAAATQAVAQQDDGFKSDYETGSLNIGPGSRGAAWMAHNYSGHIAGMPPLDPNNPGGAQENQQLVMQNEGPNYAALEKRAEAENDDLAGNPQVTGYMRNATNELSQAFAAVPEEGLLAAGPGAPEATQAALLANRVLKAFGFAPNPGITQAGDAKQILEKLSAYLGDAAAKAGNSNPAAVEMARLSSVLPSLETNKGAGMRVLAQMMVNTEKQLDFQKYRASHIATWGTEQGAAQAWRADSADRYDREQAMLPRLMLRPKGGLSIAEQYRANPKMRQTLEQGGRDANGNPVDGAGGGIMRYFGGAY